MIRLRSALCTVVLLVLVLAPLAALAQVADPASDATSILSGLLSLLSLLPISPGVGQAIAVGFPVVYGIAMLVRKYAAPWTIAGKIARGVLDGAKHVSELAPSSTPPIRFEDSKG